MKYFIYRNLHKPNYTYSLRAMEGEFKGKVVGYSSFMWLRDAEFRVSERGRQKVISSGHKNVHAGIVAEICQVFNYEHRGLGAGIESDTGTFDLTDLTEIMYNPWVGSAFMTRKEKAPIKSASRVLISGSLLEAGDITYL